MRTKPELPAPASTAAWGAGKAVLASIAVPILNVLVHLQIFFLIRDTAMHPLLLTLLAIVWGTVGIFTVYLSLNWVISLYQEQWRRRLQPLIFVSPAIVLMGWILVLPTARTFIYSFMDARSENFVGLQNYVAIFTERALFLALRNNLLWMVIGTTVCVALGLIIAVLADRSSFERTAKAIIFMPMAISFVGAGVIWRFIYDYKPGETQIGLLNAIVVAFGGAPQAWTTLLQPWNNLFLIVILIWMQTGFAMVILSAAIKGIPSEMLEAARVDGAGEIRIFFSIMIPYILGTITAVTTTIIVFTLKIFDVVIVMTGGKFGTEVIATQFYNQFFMFRNYGYGSSLAMILLLAVIPVIIFNLRKFKQEEGFR